MAALLVAFGTAWGLSCAQGSQLEDDGYAQTGGKSGGTGGNKSDAGDGSTTSTGGGVPGTGGGVPGTGGGVPGTGGGTPGTGGGTPGTGGDLGSGGTLNTGGIVNTGGDPGTGGTPIDAAAVCYAECTATDDGSAPDTWTVCACTKCCSQAVACWNDTNCAAADETFNTCAFPDDTTDNSATCAPAAKAKSTLWEPYYTCTATCEG